MDVKEFLQVRLRPSRVEPVTWVGSSLASLLCDRFIVRADLLDKSIALAWLRNWDTVLICECLELRVGPAVNF